MWEAQCLPCSLLVLKQPSSSLTSVILHVQFSRLSQDTLSSLQGTSTGEQTHFITAYPKPSLRTWHPLQPVPLSSSDPQKTPLKALSLPASLHGLSLLSSSIHSTLAPHHPAPPRTFKDSGQLPALLSPNTVPVVQGMHVSSVSPPSESLAISLSSIKYLHGEPGPVKLYSAVHHNNCSHVSSPILCCSSSCSFPNLPGPPPRPTVLTIFLISNTVKHIKRGQTQKAQRLKTNCKQNKTIVFKELRKISNECFRNLKLV